MLRSTLELVLLVVKRTLSISSLWLACVAFFLDRAWALPEAPAIWREVTGVKLGSGSRVFTHPHLPGFRTTKDGRIGVVVEGGGTSTAFTPAFALLRPEQESSSIPISVGSDGALLVAKDQNGKPVYSNLKTKQDGTPEDVNVWKKGQNFTDGVKFASHAALWEVEDAKAMNPQQEGGRDVYRLRVFVTANADENGIRTTQFFVTPLKITVANPKTSSASIEKIEKTGRTVAGPVFANASGFEPMVAGDGRLLVLRVGPEAVSWRDPNNGDVFGAGSGLEKADVRYAYYEGGDPVDVTKWDNLIPISFAPADNRVNGRFGFAAYPFRDTQGGIIPPGEDIGGSYPWIDREAKNVFIEAGDERMVDGATSKYPHRRVPGYKIEDSGETRTGVYKPEDVGKHRQVTVFGLWTKGKLVQLDNMNNSLDYGLMEWFRLVKLFEGVGPSLVGSPEGTAGELLLGYGRAGSLMPVGENDNGNIIDSVENIFNYRREMVPVSRKDVVWHFTSGHQTDEVVFDDFLEPDAFIVSSMTGSTSFQDISALGAASLNRLKHWSGWNGTSFSDPVRLQNAATDDGSRWVVPKFGELIGGGRLEPAATGGVVGKGLWLEGDNGLKFSVPDQPQPGKVLQRDWYAGLFIDSRFNDDIERQVLTFPDGSGIRLLGRTVLVYHDSSGIRVHRISLPPAVVGSLDPKRDLVPFQGWAHLGFQIRAGNRQVDFILNGMVFNRWQDPKRQLFRMSAGDLTVGKPDGSTLAGFRGWVDEFKVFARRLDPETSCNHANGSMIGLPAMRNNLDESTKNWINLFAKRFPAWSHLELSDELRGKGEKTFDSYACFFDYSSDKGARTDNIPTEAASIRASIHFPEGPLFHDRPRPESRQNKFCISCHSVDGKFGLGVNALKLVSDSNAEIDPRRQPMEPPQKVYGAIPSGLVNVSATPMPLSPEEANNGKLIDQWTLDNFGSRTTSVVGYSVVDNSGLVLMPLVSGSVIDPVKLGSSNLSIVANLDSAQGWVEVTVDGQKTRRTQPPYRSRPISLTPGNHILKTDRELGGASPELQFSVASGQRTIASFKADFQPYSPKIGWRYLWNEGGNIEEVQNFGSLSWNIESKFYTPKGLRFPDNSTSSAPYLLVGNGVGHPGRGSDQSVSPEKFAIFEYTIPLKGKFSVAGGKVKMSNSVSNGGELKIFTQSGGGRIRGLLSQTFPQGSLKTFGAPVVELERGDRIYVAVGPNRSDVADSFELDYDVVFVP